MRFTVAILKNRMIIGQLPWEICWYFLQKNGSKTTCIVSSHSESDSHTKSRRNDLIWTGKGLASFVYIIRGKQKHLDRLIIVFTSNWLFWKPRHYAKIQYVLCGNNSCDIPEDAPQGIYKREKYLCKKMGVKEGKGICSKGVYFQGLTVATQVQNCMPSL